MPAGIGVILSSLISAAKIGYSTALPLFPKLSAAVAAIPIPGFRVIAATLLVAGVGLFTSMGYFRMFY